MIKSFKNSVTEDVFNGIVRKGFQADLIKVARRKLRFLHAAHLLTDFAGATRQSARISQGEADGPTLDPRQ